MARKERGAEKRCQARGHGPPDPARAVWGIEQFVGSLQPIGVAVDVDRHPEALDAVHFRRKDGRLAEVRLDELFDERIEAVVRKGPHAVRIFARTDEELFAGGEHREEILAVERIGRDEGVARQVRRRDDVLRHPLGIGEFA